MIARSEIVGFRRQEDLARAVGCTRERIVRWSALEKPPVRMRKGFDDSLARALKTNREILFTNYVKVLPSDATIKWLVPGDDLPYNKPEWLSVPKEQRASLVARMLSDVQASFWLAIGQQLVIANQAQERREFEDSILANNYEKVAGFAPLPVEMTKEAIRQRRKAEGK